MTDKPKRTLSDRELKEREELKELLDNPDVSLFTSDLDPKPKTKVTLKNVAWGAVIYLVYLIGMLLIGGWAVQMFWNNVATDLSLPELTFTGGINVAALAVILGGLTRISRLSK